MKKIKSVKLKTAIKPLPNYEICKGVTLNAFVEGFGFDRFEFKVVYPIDLIHKRKDLFEIEFEPERKKIILEIESDFNNFDIHWLKTALEGYCHSAKFVFTELPEVFTREDIYKIFSPCFSDNAYIDTLIKNKSK